MLRKSLRSSKTRRCYPFLTEAQAKERRKGRNTESVLDNIRVIASIYNGSSVHIPFQITPTALSPFSFSFLSFISLRTETLTNSHSHNPTALSPFSYSAPIKYRHLYTTPYTPEKTNIPLKNRKVKSTIPIRALDDEETEKPNISDKTGAFTSQPVGLGKFAKIINAGKIDSSELITMKTLKDTGAIGKQIKDGVGLMGRGAEQIKWPIHLYNLLWKKVPARSFIGSPVLCDSGFDLLNKLLTYDPEKRITAEATLKHDWFSNLAA
ncbi:hypothetical protein RGQ29_004383 [Quercus rubra]|uniref:Large ribosomal subunit protein uL15/eL18 domain-containing protein n=1 Tax=Quercus rubra TaxID=3512 RepID=A0AAN7EF01_QUERU|nr:hypothetical protein RGQ29_004383 [Quercus rubra]KAK4568946.1 hypothetical protein RGQ29_004383 [Quercus rubra]